MIKSKWRKLKLISALKYWTKSLHFPLHHWQVFWLNQTVKCDKNHIFFKVVMTLKTAETGKTNEIFPKSSLLASKCFGKKYFTIWIIEKKNSII